MWKNVFLNDKRTGISVYINEVLQIIYPESIQIPGLLKSLITNYLWQMLYKSVLLFWHILVAFKDIIWFLSIFKSRSPGTIRLELRCTKHISVRFSSIWYFSLLTRSCWAYNRFSTLNHFQINFYMLVKVLLMFWSKSECVLDCLLHISLRRLLQMCILIIELLNSDWRYFIIRSRWLVAFSFFALAGVYYDIRRISTYGDGNALSAKWLSCSSSS